MWIMLNGEPFELQDACEKAMKMYERLNKQLRLWEKKKN